MNEDLLQCVSDALDIAKRYDLEAEVFLFALKAIKDNPGLSINDAVQVGLDEWIK